MKSLLKSILIAGAAFGITAATLTPASADNWHHGYNNWHRGGGGGGWHHGYGGGWGGGYGGWGGGYGGWGYGAAGLGAGLIIGSAIAQPGYYGSGYYGSGYYGNGYAPPPRYYYGAPRRYYVNDAGLRPWSPAWSRYCFSRYRTFNGRTGTFVGNDGARHFCVAN
jgi:hypothetical protein